MQVALTTENKPELAIFRLNSSSRTLNTAQQRLETPFSQLALERNRNPALRPAVQPGIFQYKVQDLQKKSDCFFLYREDNILWSFSFQIFWNRGLLYANGINSRLLYTSVIFSVWAIYRFLS